MISLFYFFNFNHYFITQKFTLNAHERLKSRKIIQRIFKEGKSFLHFPFRVMYLETEDQISPLQAGFTVSTRHFKKAIDRNRIRRLMRESYRLQKNNLVNILQENDKNLAIFFIYTGNKLPEYKDVFEKIEGALQRLEKLF
ncbi:MAG: ribonuclease P protein component [Ginsengibacter sp.]